MNRIKLWTMIFLYLPLIFTGQNVSFGDTDWLTGLMDTVHSNVKHVEDRLKQAYASSEDVQRSAAEQREKVQQQMEDQQIKLQDLQTQIEIERDRQEALQQQQQDLLQNLKDRAI